MLARLRNAKKNDESGFTLIELLVVMIIIGILAAIAIPAFLNQKKKANETAAKSDATNISKELSAALVDGAFDAAIVVGGTAPNYTLVVDTTAGPAEPAFAVKVSANNTMSVVTTPAAPSAAAPATSYCVTVTPATGTGEPWSAGEKGLRKGTACP